MRDLQLRNAQAQAYFRLVQRWWWLPLIFALISAIFAYGVSTFFISPVYQASATLQVSTPTGLNIYGTGSDASTAAVVMTTGPVLQQAAKRLGPTARLDVGALYRVGCQADSSDTFVTCTTTGHDPTVIARVLNHLARTFVDFNNATKQAQYRPLLQQVQAQIQSVQASLKGLREQLVNLQNAATQDTSSAFQATALQTQISQEQSSLSQLTIQQSNIQQQIVQLTSAVRFINPASPDRHQISPHPLRNAALAGIVGLALGTTLVLIFEFLDDRIRSVEELARIGGKPVLGTVPVFGDLPSGSRLVPVLARGSAAAEAYRLIRTNIDFASINQDAHVILVTSSSEGDGKTTTASNLAASAAVGGKSVAIVDCDLRRGGLSRKYFQRDKKGLTTALLQGPTWDTVHRLELPNLHIVPTGPLPPNSAELLASPSMREWLEWARASFDVVVLDAPPILPVADTRGLAPLADTTVLVVDTAVTDRRQLQHTMSALEAVGVSPLGFIVNRVSPREQEYGYYYDSYSAPRDASLNGHVTTYSDDPVGAESGRLSG